MAINVGWRRRVRCFGARALDIRVGSRGTRIAALCFLWFSVALGYAPAAHAERNFAVRFDSNDYGDIQIIGNTLMSCTQGANNPPTTCLASVPVSGTGATGGNLDDNNYAMRLVNTAGGTASSSSADLTLPTGATVLWAGLYWGADTSAGTNGSAAANAGARNQIRFSVPSGAYQSITAAQVDAATTAGQATRYSAFADVTTRVQAGGAGTYRVADIQAGTGGDRYAGWSLVVVVRDTSQPLRNLTVFDGYQVVNSTAATVNIAVSGFRTPLSGAFTVRAGAVAYEGDLGQTGDQLRVNGVNLGNAANPTTNVFNSTISRLATNITAKNPNFVNQMGFDADVFDASGILANGATGATLTFTTGGETYYPAVLTFANDVYQPVVEGNVVKTVTDLNGGSVLPGDVLQYTVSVANTGNDASANTVLTDAIPANTTYVAGSLQVASGANAGAKTDGSGDDQAEFNGTSVVFRLGTGATASAGGTLGVNTSTSIVFRVRVNAGVAAGTTISNQASVNYNGASLGTPFTSLSDGDPNTAGTQPTTVVVGSAQARLAITKNGTPNPVVAGQNITYTLHVDNNGPNNATGVVVSDPLPATLTFVSASASPAWTITAPAVGASGTVTFNADDLPVGGYDLTLVARVVAGTAGGSVIGNTTTLTSSNDPTGSHQAATNTTVANSGDLALTKAADAVAGQGQQIGYTLRLNNPGPDPATGVVLADPLPANTTFVSASAPSGWTATTPAVGAGGTVTFSIASLPAGVYDFAITVQATAAAPIGSTITNTATVTSTSVDSNPANNTASAGTLVQNPVPSVAKTFTPATVGSGVASTLRITITNNASVAISGVAISDTLPTTPGQMRVTNPVTGANNTCGGTFTAASSATAISLAGGALAAGASCFVEVNVVATTVGNYVNTTGSVTSTQTPTGPTATATLGVGLLNAPTTTKSFNPATVALGGSAQMTIAFANPNAAPIVGVAFTDNYPAGIANSAGTIVASNSCGGTVTATASGNSLQLANGTIPVAGCSIVVNVVATAIGNSVNTTDAITSTNAQPGAGGTGTLTVTPLSAPTSTKSFTPATVLRGASAQMTIALTNPNTTAIAQAGFSDTYPAGIANAPSSVVVSNSCGGTLTADPNDTSLALSGGTIPASGSCSIVVNIVAIADGAQVNNTGPISSGNAQTGAGASGTLTITPAADLSAAKTGPSSVGYGGAISYSIVVANAGPSDANGATFSDPLPAGVTAITANCAGTISGAVCGAVNVTGSNVTSTITTLPAGGSVTFTISGIAPFSGASLSNTATVAAPGGTTDPNTTNNASTATTALLPPQLSVTKTATPNPFTVGQPARYDIAVQNIGAGTTTGTITIADTLPTGITLASASGTGWSCAGTTALTCTFSGTLAPGAGTTLTLNVNVAANAANANNTAGASGGGDPACPGAARCASTIVVPVNASADIAIAKSVDNATPNVGENVTFTISASNNGPSNATGVAVTDALPSGLSFVSAAPSQGIYDNTTGLWTVGAIANGATATLDVTATVLSPGVLTNTATRTAGDQFDPDPSNNSGSASLNAQPSADLQVSKTVDNAVPNLGTNVVYTITVANAGPNDATGVALSDVLPAGLAFVSAAASRGSYNAGTGAWTVGAIANGASATLAITATVTLPGDITNTASISASDQFDPNTANNSGGVTINGQSSDIQIVKTVDNANPLVGDTVTFTITATNNGPSNATGLAITDALPAELTFVSANASQGTYASGTGVWTLGSLAASGPGATATLTIVATVDTDGGFTNTASVTAADQPDPNPANNSSSVVVTPVASADLSIVKTGPASVVAGQTAAYTLSVTNSGPSDAANAVLDDPTPAGLAFVSATAPCASGFPCNLGVVASGTNVNVTVNFAVPSGAAGPIANTANVISDTFDPDPSDNTSSVSTAVVAQADLLVVKTGPASVIAGAPIAYSVVVTNNGPSDANGASFADAVPAAISGVTASCGSPTGGAVCGVVNVAGNNVSGTIATLPSGGSVTFTIGGTAPADGGTLSNTANAAPPAGVTDPDTSDNTSTATTSVVASADVSIAKSGPAGATPGTSVTYTLAIANAGPSTAQAVQIADPTPAGLVFASASAPCAAGFPCALGDLAAGANATITVTYAIPANYAGATITNTASASSATGDPDASDNTSSVTTPVGALADLSVVKTGPASVAAGAPIAYTVVVANAGPSDANGASFADAVPASITGITASCGSPSGGAVCGAVNIAGNNVTSSIAALPAGGSVTFTINGTAPANATTLSNTATIAPPAGISDPASGNNSSSATTNVSASADVAIVKSGPASVGSGAAITYSLLISNAGPSAANGATYNDVVPTSIGAITASCGSASGGAVCATPSISGNTVSGNVPTLPAGGSVTITIGGTVSFGATTLNNTATAAPPAGVADPNASNNSSSVQTTVGSAADIAIAKTADNTTPNVGDTVTFTITANNQGPDDATGVAVTDGLPFGLGFVSASPSQGTYTPATGLWTIGNLANGAVATLTIVATVDVPGPLTNTAAVSASDQPDPDSSNNSAGAALNAGASADLAIVKTVDNATPNVGDTVMFTIALSNNGPNASSGSEVTDVLPAGLTPIAATPSQGSYDDASGVWTVGALANGATATLALQVTVDQAGAIANIATITGENENDPAQANNQSGAAVNGQLADIQVLKTVDNAAPNVGDSVTFTITAHDNGPDDATGVAIGDALPAGLSFVSASASLGTYSSASGVWTIGALANASTATLTIVATVQASGALTNTASVAASDQPDPNATNNSASASLNGNPLADIAVTKSGPASVTPGNAIAYTIVVTNNGPSDATNVVVDDPTPAGLSFVGNTGACASAYPCTLPSLASGASATIVTTMNVPANYAGANPIVNTASATSDTPDPDNTNNQGASDTNVGPGDADLSIVKTGPASVAAGGTIAYTLTIANNGPSPANGATYDDVVPAGITAISASCGGESGGAACVTQPVVAGNDVSGAIGALPSGGAVVVAIVGTAPNTAQTLTNAATIAPPAGIVDPDLSNDTSSVNTDVVVGTTSADLAIEKNGPASAAAGANVTYTLTVTNNGPDAAANVTLSDPTPANLAFVSASIPCAGGFPCALGDLAVGASTIVSVTFAIDTGASGSVVNVATVGSDTFDPNANNNDSSVSTTIVPASGSADLAVTKTGPASAFAGASVTYTIVVTNAGPDTATNAMLSDPTPAGLAFASAGAPCTSGFPCALGDIASGASVTVTANFTIDAGAIGSVTNTASASSDTADPVSTNNSASATTTITPSSTSADLAVLKTGPASADAGGTITYSIAVTNNGPDPAVNAVLADVPPAGLTFVSASAPCTTGFPCALGTVAVGTTTTVTATFAVAPNASGTLINTAIVSSDTSDPDGANSSSIAATTVVGGGANPPAAPVPLDAKWLLAALMLLLGAAGAVRMRRRGR